MSNYLDQRLDKFSAAKVRGLSAADGGSVLTVNSKFTVGAFGLCKAIAHKGPDLTTDTTYSISIQDENGLEVYTQSSIADTVWVWTNLTWDAAFPMIGEYTIVYTWSTGQSVTEGDFETILHLI